MYSSPDTESKMTISLLLGYRRTNMFEDTAFPSCTITLVVPVLKLRSLFEVIKIVPKILDQSS